MPGVLCVITGAEVAMLGALAVLLDRAGALAGVYRKVHLPREEWTQGVAPGNEFPVFETELGAIGIQICYDWFFPEAAACLALKGAEIIFAPTWGTTFPDKDGCVEGETVFRVRARDNGVFLIPSVYDGDSLVIDRRGRILASPGGARSTSSKRASPAAARGPRTRTPAGCSASPPLVQTTRTRAEERRSARFCGVHAAVTA